MGYWASTTYVNHANPGEVADALAAICRAEGMEPVAAPPQRQRLMVEPMQYDNALRNDLWAMALFPGAAAWTVIQTAPLELLAERAAGATRMRLAELCRRLKVSAFQMNVYDSTGGILAEVSNEGQVMLSGFNPQGEAADGFRWHGEPLREEILEVLFQLHPFQDLIAGAGLAEDKARVIAQKFGGRNAAFCDNLVSVDTLISHKPFTVPGGVVLYLKWPGRSRQRFSACASWEQYRAALRGKR
jgi:hypothetical protein